MFPRRALANVSPVHADAEPAPASSRLGQLQRGRGAGFVAALRDGAAARDDLLRCLLEDPRHDRQIEARERYYAELVVALELPLAPLVKQLRGREVGLAHGVLAGTWRLGHAPTRELLAGARTDEAIVQGVAEQLFGMQWARLVDLPPRAAAAFLREALLDADCARSARSRSAPSEGAGGRSVAELLEYGRQLPPGQRWAVVEELSRRGTEQDRAELAQVVEQDLVFGRVRLAARALGTLGDERLLALAVEHFAREDVFEDPARRLSGYDRMRRSALGEYVRHLPTDRQLDLARAWHPRGGHFEVVAGSIFGAQATPDDRDHLEAFVARHAATGGGWEVIEELEALGRIGDPRSAPLLLQVAEAASYSLARRRAVAALRTMQEVPGVLPALREALWDCEDETAELACASLPELDDAARERVELLAAHPLAERELQHRAVQRLARGAPE